MNKKRKVSKLKIIKLLLTLIIIVSIGFGYYHSRYIAPNSYKITQVTYTDKSLPNSFENVKIAFLSDINIKTSEDINRLNDIVDSINEANPDIVIFGGDLYDNQVFDNELVINALKAIKSSHGKFAVLGEKDLVFSSDVSLILNDSGFEILNNEYRKLYHDDTSESIGLFGLVASGDVSGLIDESNESLFKLVVVHEPDYFDQTNKSNIQFQLSGHSLGGYIHIPFYGGLLKRDNASNYINGTYEINNSTLIISNGLGNESTFDYRVFTPNQVLIIQLKNG